MSNDQKNSLGRATVGLVTVKKEIINSENFLAAKKGDIVAAALIVESVWSIKKTSALKEILTSKSLLITMPSTTRCNVIPHILAQHLSSELKLPFVNGDSLFNASHKQASKNISRDRRVFNPRQYTLAANASLEKLQNKKLVIVDDIITSAGSIRAFSECLLKETLNVSHIVALMGDRRLELDLKTETKLEKLIKDKEIPISLDSINHITRSVAGGIIRLLNNARSQNAIRKITESLHGLQRGRIIKDNERDPGGNRNPSTTSENKGNVGVSQRVSTSSNTSGFEWEVIFSKNGKVLERMQEILPTDLSQKDQLRKIQEKVRKFAKKKNLGQIKIDIIPRGKVAYEKPIRLRTTERGRG